MYAKQYSFHNFLHLACSAAGVLVLSICVGCNLSDHSGSAVKLQMEDTSLAFLHYSDDGKITETAIEKGSEVFKYLQLWLDMNQTGWKKSRVTFAPKHEIRAASFTLNIRSDVLVLNYQVKDRKWRQVVKDVPAWFLDGIMSRKGTVEP